MQMDKLTENWLFERHSKETISEWIKQLRFFYFKRAWGGHANDGDEFQTAFTFTNRKNLISKLGKLGLVLNSIPADFSKPISGKSYPSDEFKKFKNEIEQYKDLEQPGHTKIFNHKAFVWIHRYSIHITVSGSRDNNNYEVSEDDFKVCLELEKQFDNLGWKNSIDKSLTKNVCCISQKKYPELYGNETIDLKNNMLKSVLKWFEKRLKF